MQINIRRQLTLFLDQADAGTIEHIRNQFNPRQSELIKSHVTLCREKEIGNIERVLGNLIRLEEIEISIQFGPVIRFDEGKGVLIPGQGNNLRFQQLRARILQGVIDRPEKHAPHITLMHPRNSCCTDDIFHQIAKMTLPQRLIFQKISLIQQEENSPWEIIREFDLISDQTKPFME